MGTEWFKRCSVPIHEVYNMIPPKLHMELQKEFEFTQEFHDSHSVFANLDYGRIFIHLPPPVKQGLPELLINKALTAKAEVVVLFLPADTSTEWFATAFKSDKTEIRFVQGRIKYSIQGREKRVSSCIIVVKSEAYAAKLHQNFIDHQMARKYGNR